MVSPPHAPFVSTSVNGRRYTVDLVEYSHVDIDTLFTCYLWLKLNWNTCHWHWIEEHTLFNMGKASLSEEMFPMINLSLVWSDNSFCLILDVCSFSVQFEVLFHSLTCHCSISTTRGWWMGVVTFADTKKTSKKWMNGSELSIVENPWSKQDMKFMTMNICWQIIPRYHNKRNESTRRTAERQTRSHGWMNHIIMEYNYIFHYILYLKMKLYIIHHKIIEYYSYNIQLYNI
jgi:hypothetical protein